NTENLEEPRVSILEQPNEPSTTKVENLVEDARPKAADGMAPAAANGEREKADGFERPSTSAEVSSNEVSVEAKGRSDASRTDQHGHGAHFKHRFLNHRFLNNQAFFGGWGWGYGGSGYENTTVLAFPQAAPQVADVTGSTRAAPCHWNEDTFTVPASTGGTRPITVVSCR